MDPIMKATKRFLAEMEAIWKRGTERGLRMVAATADRDSVIKALRLAELSAENQRPLFLYESVFVEQDAYFAGLASSVEADYAALRAGVAEEGVKLPPFFSTSATGERAYRPMERALRAVERASTLLGPYFDGLTLALLPARVATTATFRANIQAILCAPLSERVRVAVFDPDGLTLGRILEPRGARYRVDAAELGAFLEQLGQRPSLGPRAVDEEVPKKRSMLRDHLTAAARSTSEGRTEDAIAHYRAARAICRKEARTVEEATVLIALAGAFLVGRTPALAMTAYEDAAAIAVKANAWALAAQARLGAGGAAMGREWYVDAEVSYRGAAEAAAQAEVPELVAEARRMEGVCRALVGSKAGPDSPELAW